MMGPRHKIKIWSVFIFIFLAFYACERQNPDTSIRQKNTLQKVSDDTWKKLSKAKIFFGHKSVGDGLVMGIKERINSSGVDKSLKIIESNSAEYDSGVFLVHSYVGKNSNPKSKMQDYQTILESGMADRIDYSILKFCWADILPNTDDRMVFNEYVLLNEKLKSAYPDLKIIHFTVPLTSNHKGYKAFTKRIKDLIKIVIGRVNYYDNSNRNRFNEMLRSRYSGKEPLFDIAKIENGYRTGKAALPSNYSLSTEYTDDGGHLNQKGREIVAQEFLIFMEELIEN